MTKPIQALANHLSGKPIRTPAIPTQTYPGGIGIISQVSSYTDVLVTYNGADIPATVMNGLAVQPGQTVLVTVVGTQILITGALNYENPAAFIYQNVNFTTSGASDTFNGCTELYVYGAMTTQVTNIPATITVPVLGVYSVKATWTSTTTISGAGTLAICQIFQNGSQVAGTAAGQTAGAFLGAQAAVDLDCDIGDTLSFGWYFSGGGLTIAGNATTTYLSAHLVTAHA